MEDVARIAPASVKICGLRTPKHAGAAALAGADLIGFIFAPSRRQVSPEDAAACIRAARLAAGCRRLFAVGVFVNESPDRINTIAESADLDLLQLHGYEESSIIATLSRPVIMALRFSPGTTLHEAEEAIDRHARGTKPPITYFIDGYHPDHYGGQGVRADWTLAGELARRYPIMLAGGLDGANVGEAIRQVRPTAVDVSSGVEIDGTKDIGKITAFVQAARDGFRLSSASAD